VFSPRASLYVPGQAPRVFPDIRHFGVDMRPSYPRRQPGSTWQGTSRSRSKAADSPFGHKDLGNLTLASFAGKGKV